jgi:hypothetical protein
MFLSWGMVLVTTTVSKLLALSRASASPENIPWVRMA